MRFGHQLKGIHAITLLLTKMTFKL
jgi:hypothetical protein